MWLNLNSTTNEKNQEHDQLDDLEVSIGSIEEEMEKNLRFLNDVDDDLNDAKLSLNEDVSLMSDNTK
jgi:hypothetical protein